MNASFQISIAFMLFACSIGAMSDFKDQYNTAPDTVYTELRYNEPSFSAAITSGSDTIDVTGLNAHGKVSFPRMLQESNDATSTLDFGLIKQLVVTNRFYQSKKHSVAGTTQLPFIEVALTFLTNKIDNFLLPQSVVVSGIDTSTGTKRAWPLNKVDNITINHKTSSDLTPSTDSLDATPQAVIPAEDIIDDVSDTLDNPLAPTRPSASVPTISLPNTFDQSTAPLLRSKGHGTQAEATAKSQEFTLQLAHSTLASLNEYSTQKLVWVYEQTKALVTKASSFVALATQGSK